MKTKRQVFILLVVVLAGILTLSAQNRKEQRAEVVRNIISSKNYKIYVDTYIPPYRDPKQLNYLDSIEIKNDSVFSDLFFVEESDIPYSGRGNELRFQVPLKKYTMDIDRKGNTHINFSVRTKVDKFNFKVVVYFDGRAIVNVFMQHHQNHFRSYDSFSRNAGIRS